MILENITILDKELYLLALDTHDGNFKLDDLLKTIRLSRPNFGHKPLRYRVKRLRKSKLLSKCGLGKNAVYTCLIDRDTFLNAKIIYTEKPIDISKNPFIIT